MGTFNAKPSDYVASQWIPDGQADECFGCQEEFSLTRRRHHCRCCGEVFCIDCWGNQVQLPADYGYKGPVKLCSICASMFEGSLRFLRMARRVVVTRHANLPQQLASTSNSQSQVLGRELSSHGGTGPGSVVQTDRSIIVTGSSNCLESQLHQKVQQAAANNPPLCKENMRKGAFEVFFLKLVNWRPFDNITHLQFSISLVAASVKDSSNFRVKNEANDPNVRVCGGKVVSDENYVPYSQCGVQGQQPSAHRVDPDDRAGTFRKRNSALSPNNGDKKKASEVAWNLPLDSILQATYDFHNEGDFITLETLQEIYRIQVADIFYPGDEGAKQVRNHRDRMTASGREMFDEIYQGAGSSSIRAGGSRPSDLASRPEGPDLSFLSAFAGQQTSSSAAVAQEGDECPSTSLAAPTSTSGRNLKFNEVDEVVEVEEEAVCGGRGDAPLSRPLKGTRYTINPDDTAKLYVELQELLKMVRSRTADGTSTIGSSRR